MEIRNNVLECIGNTPLVRLNRVAKGVDAEIVAKVEFFNPGGSVKDRIGLSMIDDAVARGVLKPGGTIVEGTSGNTGMGLAIAAALKGYKCIFVMPDKMSEEKIKNLRAFGAKVVVTPTAVEPDDPRSYYMVSRRIAEETPNAVYMNQYDNLSNRAAHYKSTGPELWRQTDGGNFDAFVAGIGTGGTITGTAMFLKEKKKEIQIVGVDPIGSILHDYFKTGKMTPAYPYKVEGIGEDIIPKNYDFKFFDEIVQINDKESFQMTRKLLLEEGLYCGVSSGAAVCGAIKYARKVGGGKRIIVLLPDSGNRYMSKVFDDVWMRENGFLDPGLGTVRDLIANVKGHSPGQLITATSDDTVERIITIMSDKGISQIPVMKGKELQGIVSESTLLNALFTGKVGKGDKISGIVEQNFVKVSLDDEFERISQAMSAGMIPIVVEGGNITTILTKIDLINYMGSRNK